MHYVAQFFHWVPPVTYENEMHFYPMYFSRFLQDFTWPDAINCLFSFWGFYGVYLFIFLSGYGLTKSFANHHTERNIRFIGRHIAKIYLLFYVVPLYIYLSCQRLIIEQSCTYCPWQQIFRRKRCFWFVGRGGSFPWLFSSTYCFFFCTNLFKRISAILFWFVFLIFSLPYTGWNTAAPVSACIPTPLDIFRNFL